MLLVGAGTATIAMLVGVPFIVVGIVVVNGILPEVIVLVWGVTLDNGTPTRIMLVGIPLIVVGSVVVNGTVPEVMVLV